MPLLERPGLRYFLMVDGRGLPGGNVNPPDALLAGPCYLGRQTRETDGAFNYWGVRRQDALFTDLFHRSRGGGGILRAVHPVVRPDDCILLTSYHSLLTATK